MKVITTTSWNCQKECWYKGKAPKWLWRGIILNNDSGVFEWKDYSMKEAWHVCFMIYWNSNIFPIVVDSFNSIMA
jgi:hypothetical protein